MAGSSFDSAALRIARAGFRAGFQSLMQAFSMLPAPIRPMSSRARSWDRCPSAISSNTSGRNPTGTAASFRPSAATSCDEPSCTWKRANQRTSFHGAWLKA